MNKDLYGKIITEVRTIAYFWLNERNYGLSLTLINLLNKLDFNDLNNSDEKNIKDLEKDWNTLFESDTNKSLEKDEIVKQSKVDIPLIYTKNNEEKLLYIATQTIMNDFNLCEFELSFRMLMNLIDDFPTLYINIIYAIQHSSDNIKKMITDWLNAHTLMSFDINKMKSINYAGYEISIKKTS